MDCSGFIRHGRVCRLSAGLVLDIMCCFRASIRRVMAWSLMLELSINVGFEYLTGCVSMCWFEACKPIRQLILYPCEYNAKASMPSWPPPADRSRPTTSSPMLPRAYDGRSVLPISSAWLKSLAHQDMLVCGVEDVASSSDPADGILSDGCRELRTGDRPARARPHRCGKEFRVERGEMHLAIELRFSYIINL
jgi:hypothetical protein